MASFTGDSGNNSILGTAGDDEIDISQGGADTVLASLGADLIHLGPALGREDRIDGSDGIDVVTLDGDYSLVLQNATLVHVEVLQLAAGHDYFLKTKDGTVEAGQAMGVDASALGAGDSLILNTAKERDGAFAVTGGAGVIDFRGGKGADLVTLGQGLAAGSHFDGGGGFDRVDIAVLAPTAEFTFDAALFQQIDAVHLIGGSVITVTMADDAVAARQLFVLDAGEGGQVLFDGRAETDGRFGVVGSIGRDHLLGGALGDYLDGGEADDFISGYGGADTLVGGEGVDTLYGGEGRDLIVFGSFDLPGPPAGGGRPDQVVYTTLEDSTSKRPDFIADLSDQALINLRQIDANWLKDGDQAFKLVAAFTHHAGELSLTYVAENDVTFLQGDVDGDGQADLEIDIAGDHTDFTGFVF